MKTRRIPAAAVVFFAAAAACASAPLAYAPLRDTRVTGGFWYSRVETNRLVTLKTDFAKCRETPRIANITNAALRAWGTFGGCFFDDSDVFKVMEGAAYIYAQHPDPALEKEMTELIGWLAKAQEPDGYLYCARTLGAESVRKYARWETLKWGHELYNQGHMIEAAVAWYEATGRTDFLTIARKSADLMCRTFGYGPTQIKSTSGHEEIELALCKLARATGEKKYLELAKFFLDMRGRKDLRETWGADIQDHAPVLEQKEAIGHAVRAGYLYTGMADVAAATGDRSYVEAIDRLWENVVSKKFYLTGGIGARQSADVPGYGKMWEAFNGAYDLPNDNDEAYLETCAAIANCLWNGRMFLFHRDGKYFDVFERTLYNGFLSGVSISGDEFFYPNPLASKGGYKRSKWFGCSCCPVNDVRFIPQIATYAYASDGEALYWNLFIDATTSLSFAGGKVSLKQKTEYPWRGEAALEVTPGKDGAAFTLYVRIPGWARGEPVPSDLYRYRPTDAETGYVVSVNGAAVNGACVKGYVAVSRAWKAGDVVTVSFEMPVRRVEAHPLLKQDAGRLAVERGPIVYCAEGFDNGGKAYGAVLPADATFGDAEIAIGDRAFPALKASNGLTLIPYFAWDHRDPGNEMQVWFKEK